MPEPEAARWQDAFYGPDREAFDDHAYTAECERRRQHCLLTTHDWRIMGWEEAYPAFAGRVCNHCDLYQLSW